MEGSSSHTVLLAEAEPAVASVVSSRLGDAGIDVHWVRTVREARSALLDDRPDLLVLDVALETDGLEFFQALRSRPEAPPGGVVVLTDRADVHARERAHQLGAAAVVTKPIKPEDVAQVVQELLRCM